MGKSHTSRACCRHEDAVRFQGAARAHNGHPQRGVRGVAARVRAAPRRAALPGARVHGARDRVPAVREPRVRRRVRRAHGARLAADVLPRDARGGHHSAAARAHGHRSARRLRRAGFQRAAGRAGGQLGLGLGAAHGSRRYQGCKRNALRRCEGRVSACPAEEWHSAARPAPLERSVRARTAAHARMRNLSCQLLAPNGAAWRG
ncbi:hypothetical protein JKP88DRAFT_231390 [Tribonema minus]|uniref:Uncharacterized protein n=1 Tax=Tribonema minus TaxID=303371 RepID=A0A836CMV8_9STRA|nr:hypothetical protein JKP88DRAFT_231390 [Tribonema minus]